MIVCDCCREPKKPLRQVMVDVAQYDDKAPRPRCQLELCSDCLTRFFTVHLSTEAIRALAKT